eukprot:CAMPEP_0194205268 /NCGR_PEP_ID=MMETSP0156-20130528/4583_1 /TAXON_ID=33649 /ORGANISM="Thalassionema nitzschioides, Strain L26-B" /LENGTH=83 /DNA_ID=CAMNT_0038931493 /DNA_START=20 /DNA_END=271 /DNA_ORIENTATION=-
MTPSASFVLLCLTLATALIQAEARKKNDVDYDFETVTDYVGAFLKVTLACSPILIIGGILFFAREDDEAEKKKLEVSKCCTKK